MNISFATYNIWFDNYEQIKRASQVILEILGTKPKISVIALHEVTKNILDFIKNSPLNEYYYIPKSQTIYNYDSIIIVLKIFTIEKLVIQPFTHTKMSRNLKIVTISVKLNSSKVSTFLIATSHLESEFKIKNPNLYKMNQLSETFTILDTLINENTNKYDMVVFMGDTNIISKEQKVFDEIIPDDWKDYFIEFGSPKVLEYTYDHTKNNNVRFPVKSRLDRLYFKNLKNLYEPFSFTFLGQEPSRNNLFPSDHFGILATFELKNLL
jgi:exonuclease III